MVNVRETRIEMDQGERVICAGRAGALRRGWWHVKVEYDVDRARLAKRPNISLHVRGPGNTRKLAKWCYEYAGSLAQTHW